MGTKLTPDMQKIYNDAKATYDEAQANIEKNGAVVAHPRTGAPIENPYIKIRDKAVATMAKALGTATKQRVFKLPELSK